MSVVVSTPFRLESKLTQGCKELWASVLIAMASLAGCGGDGGATIDGKVTYQGQPVTSGLINFSAPGKRPIGAPLQPDGSYQLVLSPGEYQVRVDSPAPLPAGWKEGDPLPSDKDRPVPAKYANFDSSGLTATIEANGDESVDIAIP